MREPGVFEILAVALGVGLGTLALRLGFGELRGRVPIGPRLRAALEWVPVAALAALVFPAFAPVSGTEPVFSRLAAAVAAGAVAWKTRNLLFAVLSGMASYWIVGALT